jgi:Lrp/AsnC ligand binding domain
VRDTRDYERLLRERLYRIPGIRHTKSSFVLGRLKESLLPLSATPIVTGADANSARPRTGSASKTPRTPARGTVRRR